MVSVLTSRTLLQNSTFVARTSNGSVLTSPTLLLEFYFCSCSVKQNGHQMVPVLTSPTLLQNFYFCSCSVKQNGHQMVSVLTSPTLLQNSTFVVVV